MRTKVYTNIHEAPGKPKIGQCSAVLPNHMQCWRAGDVIVTIVEPSTESEPEKVTCFQLCRGHATLAQEQDKLEAAAEAAKPVPAKSPVPVLKK